MNQLFSKLAGFLLYMQPDFQNMPEQGQGQGENPFSDIVNGNGPLGGQAVQNAMMGQGDQQGQPQAPETPNEGQVGQTGDQGRALLSSLQGIHRFIQGTQDREAIGKARMVINILVDLIRSDQQTAVQAGGVVAQAPQTQNQTGG